MSKQSRRWFLKSSLIAGSACGLSAKTYRSIFADEAPSERIRIGMIGLGNQGNHNLRLFRNNVVALCDLDENYLGVGAEYLSKETGRRAMMTDDYRRLLDSKEIDAVVITVPDHWHALMTIGACNAGKDVYCEKPLTLTIAEGNPMVEAARRNKRVAQVGSMQRSGDEFKLAIDLVSKGLVGKISAVNVTLPGPNWIKRAGMPVADSAPPAGFDFDRWLGPAPLRAYNKNRVHYLFRFFWDYSGGQQTNFGAHHLDIAQWGLGMDSSGPTSVEGVAQFHPEGWYETPDSTELKYTYANGVKMTVWQNMKSHLNTSGTEFVGDKGALFVHRGGIKATPDDLLNGIEIPKVTSSQSDISHAANFLDCIKTRNLPVADIAIGHRSATVCHLGNIALRTGKKIHWDPVTEQIVGDAEAAKWMSREYRDPWKLT